MSTARLWPRLGALVPFPTVTGPYMDPAGEDAPLPLSDYLVNNIQLGDIVTSAPPQTNPLPPVAGVPTWSWQSNPGMSSLVQQMLPIGQEGYDSPSLRAADSNSATYAGRAIVMKLAAPINYASIAADSPPNPLGGAPVAGWKNITFYTAEATEVANMNAFFSGYKAAGGRAPDMLAVDMEDSPNVYFSSVAGTFEALWEDPVGGVMLQGYLIRQDVDTWQAGVNAPYQQHWNYYTESLMLESMKRAYVTTLKSHYVDCAISEYGNCVRSEAEGAKAVYASTHPDYQYIQMGTHSSPEYYGLIGNAGTLYGSDAFSVFRWEINRHRASLRSAPDQKMAPWVGYPSFTFGIYGADPIPGAKYHRELVYHLALLGSERFLYFNAGATATDEATWHGYLTTLATMLGLGGVSTRDISLVSFTGDKVVSGCRTSMGSYVWRCSVKMGAQSIMVNGSVVPIPSNERGVWYTTLSATPPNFVVT